MEGKHIPIPRQHNVSTLLALLLVTACIYLQIAQSLPVSARLATISSAYGASISPTFIEATVADAAKDFADYMSKPPALDLLQNKVYPSLPTHADPSKFVKDFHAAYIAPEAKLNQGTIKNPIEVNTLDLLKLAGDAKALGTARKSLTEVVRICIDSPHLFGKDAELKDIFPMIVITARGVFRIQRHFRTGQCVGAAEKQQGGNGKKEKPYSFTTSLPYKYMTGKNNNLLHNMGIFERARGDLGTVLLRNVPALVKAEGSAAMIRLVGKISQAAHSYNDLKDLYTNAVPTEKRMLNSIVAYFKQDLKKGHVFPPPDVDSGDELDAPPAASPARTRKTPPSSSSSRSSSRSPSPSSSTSSSAAAAASSSAAAAASSSAAAAASSSPSSLSSSRRTMNDGDNAEHSHQRHTISSLAKIYPRHPMNLRPRNDPKKPRTNESGKEDDDKLVYIGDPNGAK